MKRFIVKLPIERKGYGKTNSARFKGILSFVSNQHGVIYDWKMEFTAIDIDLCTTKSWFNKKNKNFDRREVLFSKLNLKQIPREKQSSHQIITLDHDQVILLNDYFNDRNLYNSTIKNIVAVLKGNNPGGEAKRPKSAEIIMTGNESIKNFVILLDDLTMKQKTLYDSALIGAEEIAIEAFAKLNEHISCAFSFMQKSKNYSSWKNYLNGIKEYYKKYNEDLVVASSIANKARAKYSTNVENVKPLPFGFKSSNQFQKCHIYEFHNLRDDLIEAIREQKSTQKFEDMISDKENFIPFPNEIHRKFDANYFTYKLDGTIWPIDERGKEYVDEYVDEKYKKIPIFFLTNKKKKYLEKRNRNINFID